MSRKVSSVGRLEVEFKVSKGAEFLPHWEIVKTAKPSELVEFDRGLYRHWAMYSGDGMIFNICAEDREKTEAWIRLQPLEYVCQLDPNPQHQLCRINNKPEIPGVVLRPAARSQERALEAAKLMLDTKEPFEFNGRNSEYYCNLWKFGRIFSDQAMEAARRGCN